MGNSSASIPSELGQHELMLPYVLTNVLRLPRPWSVRRHQFDSQQDRLDIWVASAATQRHGWFNQQKKTVFLAGTEHSWRHLDTCGWQTYVHVEVPLGQELPPHAWAGETGQAFSRGMSKFVFELLYKGVELGAICSLYGIGLDTLWRFKYSLDQGKTRIQANAGNTLSPSSAQAHAQRVEDAGASPLPDVSHPVWRKLATGEGEINIHVLSLKLLLTRVRSQMAVIHDEAVRELKAAELHRYFNKNSRLLVRELQQIGELAGELAR